MTTGMTDPRKVTVLVPEVERWLDFLFVAAEGATLRQEDRRKAIEVAAALSEIQQSLRHVSRRSPLVLVDAAAGKSYLGLLAAKLLLEPRKQASSLVAIERDPLRMDLSRRAAERLQTTVPIECRALDVADAEAWPARPSIVVALHACGRAADTIIERSIACEAQNLLLVPCCTSHAVPAARVAAQNVDRLGIPRHAPVRRRFIQAFVDADRTWRLEAAGYHTQVVEFVPPTVTPHNLLWRSRRVMEPKRMAAAQAGLDALRGKRE
jgi:hypothetical protein